MSDNKEFIDALIAARVASDGDLNLMLDQYNGDAFLVIQTLLRKEAAPKETLGKIWGDLNKIAYVDLEKTIFQSSAVLRLPERTARKLQLIPLYRLGDRVTAAVSNPMDKTAIREAEAAMNISISPVFSFPDEISDAIDIQYQSTYSFEEYAAKLPDSPIFRDMDYLNIEQVEALAEEKPVMNFTHALLMLGVKDRASEIHVEHLERLARVRFRIDGVLHEKYTMDKAFAYPLACRLKHLARLDLTEYLKPQHGRISIRLMRKSLNFRLNVLPMIQGEKVSIHMLKSGQENVNDLAVSGISRSIFNGVLRALEKPGLFIVAGPVQSGKTTTMFSLLKHLNKPELDIVTIEDFPEFKLPGVNQTQTDPDGGYTFAAALKALRMANPDVILIGDIDNGETAALAVRSAMEGRQVLSIMSAAGASWIVARLIEIGVSRFMAASALRGVLAQQLVRRLCEYCKEPYSISDEMYGTYFKGPRPKEDIVFYRAKGCPECEGKGYDGQIPVHEFFPMNREIRSLMTGNTTPFVLEKVAEKYGFNTMRHDVLKKILMGYTTVEELERSTFV